MSAADFDAARSKQPTMDELRIIAERAQDCAASEVIKRDRSTWQVRAGLWQTLAEAAFACESMLARDVYNGLMGEPEQRGAP
jgi:hypothetical protein